MMIPAWAKDRTVAVCLGNGVDSTAMLIRMIRLGIRPEVITFADVGAERPETYEHAERFSDFLEEFDFPRPKTVVYQPEAKTQARYEQGAQHVFDHFNITADKHMLSRWSRLYGNMLANETLPGIAFSVKSCSVKWKIVPQEHW
jgi:hypothetical protein